MDGRTLVDIVEAGYVDHAVLNGDMKRGRGLSRKGDDLIELPNQDRIRELKRKHPHPRLGIRAAKAARVEVRPGGNPPQRANARGNLHQRRLNAFHAVCDGLV